MIHALLLMALAAPTMSPATCPSLGVRIGKTRAGKPIFRAIVGAKPAGGLTFNWALSAGIISSGQGTGKIVVEAPKGTSITATVQIGGLPSTCDSVVSASASIPGRHKKRG